MRGFCSALFMLLTMFAFLLTSNAQAHSTDSELTQYRVAELSLRYSPWTGMSIWRNGIEEDLSFFGGNSDEIFAGSPEALDTADTVQTLRVTGVSLWVASLAGILLGAALAGPGGLSEDTDSGRRLTTPGVALFGGAIATNIAGSVLVGVSYSYVSDAIVYYNRDLYMRLRKPRASAVRQRQMVLGWSGHF